MSSQEVANSLEVEEGPSRSYAREVLADTFGSWRARLGAVWIGILVLMAVFAPLIANSQPILLKMHGKWSSPLLENLTAVDVMLLILATAGLVLLALRRVVWRRRAAMLLVAGVVLSAVLALLLVRPPETVVYERYRVAKKAGEVEYVLYTPIPYSPTDRLRDQPGTRLSPPSAEHWLGTEVNGADVLSRMIHASRIALSIGFISTGIAVAIGVVVGGIMGYFAGRVDMVGMRLVEIFEAIPTLFLLITFVAFFERSLYMIMVIIGLVGWTGNARFIRAEFLKLRKQDFVQAAIAAGLPLRSVLFRHMLPNGITPVLVSASFGVASAILAEATLSFLGLGLVDEPSWGQMLEQARSVGGTFTWWMAIFPGLAIFLTVFAYNMVGESLRDAIDPRIRKE
ncbi:MAG TPA: ABC transporter permease [Tepidisphaeraceae bacterium]|nr:ABC transporter permease [Tepidisphaeraceae bacterium]